MVSSREKRTLEGDAWRRHYCKDVDRARNDAAASQGMPQVASGHQNLGEWHGADSSSGLSEGANLPAPWPPNFSVVEG